MLRVGYYYDYPDESTFRYRVRNMVEALRLDAEISAAIYSQHRLRQLRTDLPQLDVLIMSRARATHELLEVVSRARTAGVRLVFDIDDLIFDLDFIPMVADTISKNPDVATLDFLYGNASRIREIALRCDYIFASTKPLAQISKSSLQLPVSVLPNFFNTSQLAAAYPRQALDVEATSVGYFSGSPTHYKDFAVVREAVIEFLLASKFRVLTIGGYMELRAFPREVLRQVNFLPMQSPSDLQRSIAQVDINVAPLKMNAFTNCKSELKYFEAALVRVPTIATPTEPYMDAISTGHNGVLATESHWYEALSELSCNRTRYAEIAANAQTRVVSEYSPSAILPRIREALLRVLN